MSTLKNDREQLFIPRSEFRKSFVNRLLSEQERRIQYRVIRHIEDAPEREFLALNPQWRSVADRLEDEVARLGQFAKTLG